MKPIKQLQKALFALPPSATEGSYYSPLEVFLKAHFSEKHGGKYTATAQETAAGKIGLPDITVRAAGGEKIGWLEVKTPDENLSDRKFAPQFDKYKAGLENIIFTNFRQWELWQWQDGKPRQAAAAVCDIVGGYAPQAEGELYKLLARFKERSVVEVSTTEKLAFALAQKAKLLAEQVKENLDEADEESALAQLKKAFEKTLIQNIKPQQFANIVAETVTYSLFLAALESEQRGEKLTIETAFVFLPKNVPVLRALYNLVLKTSARFPAVKNAAELVIDQLRAADLFAVLEEINKRKPGEDAVIHFYEPFLAEYSPQERKTRGVYYTPKPVVDFIVRGTDFLLQKHFGKKDGLADEQVQILDPAAGTGTFLLSAIEAVRQKTEGKFSGTGLTRAKFAGAVSNHILKNFYGFELMVAPYAIAHLKLTMELARMGCAISGDSRLQIYLANTLDNPNAPPKKLFGWEELSEENKMAGDIKRERPILAVIGNPPYANFGMMNKQKWILDLLGDYKKGLGETRINLDDDYIKFIRFAQWKIAQTGKGVFAMITNNSFIDGITHRRMRASLLGEFDEIYIVNLHGDSRKGETAPGGGKDENVFDIQQGVSINIFVKKGGDGGAPCKVFYADARGTRAKKFQMLEKHLEDVEWRAVNYLAFNKMFLATKWGREKILVGGENGQARLGALNFFAPGARGMAAKMAEYGKFWGVRDVFQEYNSGVQTKRDALTVQFDGAALENIIKDFAKLNAEQIRDKYQLPADGDGWKISWAKKDLAENEPKITAIDYRPFDAKKTIFTGKSGGFVARPRTDIMRHMLKPNLAFVSERLIPYQADISVFCSASVIDAHLVGGNSYAFPLYTYPENHLEKANGERTSNLRPEFTRELEAKHGKKPAPEEVFYYAYAVFHCPQYRQRYAEFLRIDFPRLPLAADKNLFAKLARLGRELVNLHLLGKNSFDNSATIFDAPQKWKISIGGKAIDENWQVDAARHDAVNNRVYANKTQYFAGIDAATWKFQVGNYQPLYQWLKDRKKANRPLSADDKEHYLKIAVSLRETRRVMREIDALIPDWQKFCK